MSVKPMVTMKRPRGGTPNQPEINNTEISATPNQPIVAQRQNYVVNTSKLQDKNQMDDQELSYYVKRLRSKHSRLTTKWFGMRKKHGKDECPYCGSFTGGGFCIMHQRDYDEYMTAEVMLMNRSFME
tara:strand:+ start:1032 stop:1412 length:381 start_codon:yes stop_codon:yes gene_type:complete